MSLSPVHRCETPGAYRRLACVGVPLIVATLALPSGACTTRCRGPGCEDDFESMSVAGISGGALLEGESDIDDLTTLGEVVGLSSDGTGWSVAAAPGTSDLFVGKPEGQEVVRVSPASRGQTDIGTEEAVFLLPEADFGAQIALVSDGTDTGFDLWAASPSRDLDRGAIVRYPGAHEVVGLAPAPVLLVRGDAQADRLGSHLFPCGDLTGDGRDDLVVSIPWWQPDPGLEVLGGASVPNLAGAVVVLTSEAFSEAVGERRAWELGPVYWGTAVGAGVGPGVACRHDLDGDGLVDLAVGEPRVDEQAGAAHLITQPLPDPGPLDLVAWRSITSPEPAAWFGEALTPLVWGDETLLAIGAPGEAEGQGATYLFRPTDPEPLTPVGSYDSSRNTPDHVGRSLSAIDLDGDGNDELFVGAPDYREDNRTFGVGRLWVFRREEGLAPDLQDAVGIVTDTQPFRRIGRDLVFTDIDGDDLPDLWMPTQRP